MISVACCKENITPRLGLPLSGFAFRMNKPSTHVDDPIQVRVLVIRNEDQYYLIASYELLGVGRQLQDIVFQRLTAEFQDLFRTENCILTAVHNHSAPTTMALEGENHPDKEYLYMVAERTTTAVHSAINELQPANAFLCQKEIHGLTYNRRAVLIDGRVTMAIQPDGEVVERGPVDPLLTQIVFRNLGGKNIAGITHFSCHGVAICTMGITHDAPGRISREIETLIGAPCLLLQGGAGDINPTIVSVSHNNLDGWSDNFRAQIQDVLERLHPVEIEPLVTKNIQLPINFRDLPSRSDVKANLDVLHKLAEKDVDIPQAQGMLRKIADIINLPPGKLPEVEQTAYFARALIACNENILAAIDSGTFNGTTILPLTFWRMGEIRLVFAGAELFAQTGIAIRNMHPDSVNLLVTYAGPVVGYIPDDKAMRQGGYEVNDAWMFYGQPAPFAEGTIEYILKTVQSELNDFY